MFDPLRYEGHVSDAVDGCVVPAVVGCRLDLIDETVVVIVGGGPVIPIIATERGVVPAVGRSASSLACIIHKIVVVYRVTETVYYIHPYITVRKGVVNNNIVIRPFNINGAVV